MAYNGSGVFNLYTPGNPTVTNTTISSTWANNTLSDIATGLSTAITKDGQTTPTANIPMATFKFTGLGAGSAATDSASIANIQNGTGIYVATVGGTADVITLTVSPAVTAYAAGQTFCWIASGTNTTNVTVNVSGLGAKALTKSGSTALAAGDIASGAIVTATYDGTQFQVDGVDTTGVTTFSAGTTGLTPSSATAGAVTLAGTLAVANGGTGQSTYTDGQLLIGNSSGNTLAKAALTAGANVTVTNGNGTITLASGPTSGTAQATTSGIAIDFTSLPATVKRIMISFVGVSSNGTSGIVVRIGDSGGIEPTGYSGAIITSNGAGGGAAGQNSTGFFIGGGSAAYVLHGVMTLTLVNAATFTWAATVAAGHSDSALAVCGGGSKSLTATLDRVQLATENGTDAFDAGSVNILYE